MEMISKIEELQNTYDMLNVLYEDYNFEKFTQMARKLPYDKVLIPDTILDIFKVYSNMYPYQKDMFNYIIKGGEVNEHIR